MKENNTDPTSNGQHNIGHVKALQPLRVNEENTFNIKELLFKFYRYWPYFIISIGISLIVAYFYNRYSSPLYYTNTSLLVKDRRNSSASNESFLEGMSLVNVQRNIENEVSLLRSYSMAQATARQLDFGVSYYQEGKVRTSEIYGDIGFKVEVDSSHIQLLNTLYTVEILNGKSFSIKAKTEGSVPFNVKEQTSVAKAEAFSFKEGTYNFDEYLEGKYYKFKVTKLNPDLTESTFMFKFNTYSEVAGQYSGIVVRQLSKTSSVVEISIETTQPAKGIAYLNKLCQVYIQIGLDEKNKIAENTISFIDYQINNLADSLNYSEDMLQRFRTDNRFFDLASESGVLFNNLERLKEEKEFQENQLKYYDYIISYANTKKDFSELMSPSVSKELDPTVSNSIALLQTLYSQRNVLQLSGTIKNQEMIENQKRIQSALSALKESLNNAKSFIIIQRNNTNIRIIEAEKILNKLPKTERNLLSIKRKFTLNEDMYTYLLKKRAEAGIAKAANLPDNKVIDAASRASQIYPKTQYNYTVAFVLGFLIPIVLILILDYFNDTVSNRKELESLTTIPILGVIGHNDKPSRLVVAPGSKSIIAEAFRSLRSNLQYVIRTKEKKIILVTSTISGEGKTFSTNNLAYVLALSGKKTLLMEVDLRKPASIDDFGIEIEYGLTHYLIGKATKEQIVRKTQYEFLDIVQAGEIPPNPSEMLMDEKMGQLMIEFQKDYDYIIMDSSPIGLVADAFELIKYADLVLFVVRQGYTKRDYVSKLEDIHRIETTKSFNIILNDAKIQSGGYGYGKYGYTYGYAYGYGYYDEEPKPQNVLQKILKKDKNKM